MSQDWASDLYTTATEANTTLSNMELMFATLKSLFSGAAAPANQVAGMPWFDTTKKVMKQRNQGDTAWIGLMHGDTSQKMWVYRNSAMDGWAVDSGVSDKVLAIKGGTTYTAGAATAGSWTLSGFGDFAHNHQWYDYRSDAIHKIYDSNGDVTDITANTDSYRGIVVNADLVQHMYLDAYTADSAAIANDGTWRAAAAVGTLQYLDL